MLLILKELLLEFKNIDIPVCFLQEQFDIGLFLPKYEKSSFMPVDMCNKPRSGPIISRSTKCMTGFRSYHLTWQQRQICCQYRRRHSWYLPLSQDDWVSKHIYQFRSALSSFWPFVFHQQWCRNSPDSHCSSPHETEKYFWMLWKNWTQIWCMHHPWSKIPPTKS